MTVLTRHLPLGARLLRTIGDRIAPQAAADGRLCILNYHRVLVEPDPLIDGDPDVNAFRAQMELLAECFTVLPLAEAVSMLGKERMPPRAVCVTFDDGYRSLHDLALPILKEFDVPATVFVTSGCLDADNMWNDRIVEAVRRIPGSHADLRDIGIGLLPIATHSNRKRAIELLTRASKYLPQQQRLDLAQKLEILAGNARPSSLMLTKEMTMSLARQGIEIGGHTITHPILTQLDDETAIQEITGCKQQLEAITGKHVRLFAYPNGKTGLDYDERHTRMAKEAGYMAAFASAPCAAGTRDDRYQIPRSLPWDRNTILFGMRILRWLRAPRTM